MDIVISIILFITRVLNFPEIIRDRHLLLGYWDLFVKFTGNIGKGFNNNCISPFMKSETPDRK